MTNHLERLIRLLPPPAEPVAPPPWERTRAEAGLCFPADYRAFVNTYGGGRIMGAASPMSCHIYAPTSAPGRLDDPVGFRGFVDWCSADTADLFEGADPGEWGGVLYPVYPDPGGLLFWGQNEEGDMYWWLTEDDDPDRWPVMMWARGPAEIWRFDTGMVEFVANQVAGGDVSPDWMHAPGARWTMTSDWRRRGLNVSAGPGKAPM